MVTDPHAMYVFCDGAMDYDSYNSGGIGYLITFPDFTGFDPLPISMGTYKGGNIERLEIEALIQALKEVLDIFKKKGKLPEILDEIVRKQSHCL
jgi:hypothetical protein